LLADEEKAAYQQRFFKTGEGQYAEADVFWGIKIPETRQIAIKYRLLPLTETAKLIQHQVHEVRLCGLFILEKKFELADEKEKKDVVDCYLTHTDYINNWDLVDSTAYVILGNYLVDKPRDVLYQLAKSNKLWSQRIAIVSTLSFIRNNDFDDTLSIAEILFDSPHDLIHKAIGWMLREMGKRNQSRMMAFLRTNYSRIPRTSLRYAIEKLPEFYRKNILKGKFKVDDNYGQ
jgi:3-methyladenine DNA glycosylase AlkD